MDFTLGYKGEDINELLGKASTALQESDIESFIALSRDFSDDFQE